MEEIRFCSICGINELRKRQIKYCSLKCKIIGRNMISQRIHKRNKQDEESHDFPSYICQKCGFISKLTFYPNKKFRLWKIFQCQKCGHYRDNDI
jgi:hypothetical protein